MDESIQVMLLWNIEKSIISVARRDFINSRLARLGSERTVSKLDGRMIVTALSQEYDRINQARQDYVEDKMEHMVYEAVEV